MQTTMVEAGSRMEAPIALGGLHPFSSRNDLSGLRDTASKSSDRFAEPENGDNRAVIAAMVNSKIYQEYEKAFSEATGMPVALRPVESWQLPHAGNRSDTSVPVLLGDRLIGFLQTGNEWDSAVDRSDLDETFFAPETASVKQHDSVVKLLGIFAQHLSMLSNQVVVRQENAEPPAIARAKQFILEHQAEDLSLGQ